MEFEAVGCCEEELRMICRFIDMKAAVTKVDDKCMTSYIIINNM